MIGCGTAYYLDHPGRWTSSESNLLHCTSATSASQESKQHTLAAQDPFSKAGIEFEGSVDQHRQIYPAREMAPLPGFQLWKQEMTPTAKAICVNWGIGILTLWPYFPDKGRRNGLSPATLPYPLRY